jgi:hypothetical protein
MVGDIIGSPEVHLGAEWVKTASSDWKIHLDTDPAHQPPADSLVGLTLKDLSVFVLQEAEGATKRCKSKVDA